MTLCISTGDMFKACESGLSCKIEEMSSHEILMQYLLLTVVCSVPLEDLQKRRDVLQERILTSLQYYVAESA